MTADPSLVRRRWLCVTTLPYGGERFVLVGSPKYPDAMRVELPPEIARQQIGDDLDAEAETNTDGAVTLLRVARSVAPKAPAVWFAELRESAARPPAVNLVLFTGAGQPADTLVDSAALAELPVSSSDQLGALRWWPGTGEVDQVYVQPQWRRRSLATVLVVASGLLARARGWPKLWADGQRTQQGEQFRNAASWRHRTDDLTHIAPPMTPGEA